VLDFSAVNNTDITSLQGLIDTRNFLDRHAAPATVEWHFANVTNRWTRRALAVAGFGFPIADMPEAIGNWAPVYNVARSFAGATPDDVREDAEAKGRVELVVDEERSCKQPVTKAEFEMQQEPIGDLHNVGASSDSVKEKSVPPRSDSPVLLYGMDRPFFHIDLVEAVDAAVRDAERAEETQG
jgi:solute carrier family 26 (sodium-independent sulfate anion transporter), member 11